MVADATAEFEKKRNRPVKYDRELIQNTLQVMKRVSEVKSKREKEFWKKRMEGNEKIEKIAAKKELEKDIHLIKAPAGVKKLATPVKTALKEYAEEKMDEEN